MKRTERIKKWIVDHQDGIAIGTIATFYVVAVGAAVALAVKADAEYDQAIAELEADEEKRREEIQDALYRGDTILQNSDGSYWIIPDRNSQVEGRP